MTPFEKLTQIYSGILSKIPFVPEIAVVLGSGLGDFADSIDVISTIDYSEIGDFPQSTVPGHKGRFVFGFLDSVPLVIMQGRVHYYEGYGVTDVVLPIRLMRLMGAKTLLLTNAAGGVGEGFRAGDLMLITDHITSFMPSPLLGPNVSELGTRFPDMSNVYDSALQECIREAAKKSAIALVEGVYCQLTGPAYETPAEVQMYKKLGASALGMSTAVEATAAVHAGMKVCGISMITNLAAGISPIPLTHTEVTSTANRVAPVFKALLRESILRISALKK